MLTVYQSIARYSYLREVRQKAADLYMAEKPIDPLKAIVMIQAVILTLFPQELLGISFESSIIKKNIHDFI